MEQIPIKIIIIAVVALVATIKVFANSKPLPTLVGFCGLFALILIVWNTIAYKIS
jgi:hypothetical protein